MSLDVAQRTIDYILSDKTLSSDESVVLDFIGGEPLLEISLIKDIVNYFIEKVSIHRHSWQYNYTIRITTNGLLYSSDAVQSFIAKFHDHLAISISIDGNKDKTNSARMYPNGRGSYDDVLSSIPLWRKQFPNEGTKMTISHDDLQYVFESVKHLLSLGIYKIDINPVLEDVWQDGDDEILEDQLVQCADYIIDNRLYNSVDLSCFEGGSGDFKESDVPYDYGICGSFTFAVDYSGDFYSCLRFAKFSLRNQPARRIGNLKDGINWNLMRPFQTFCRKITSDKCISCGWQSACKICPAENYDSSDTSSIYEQSFSACKMHRAKLKAKNYFWNKLSFTLSRNE